MGKNIGTNNICPSHKCDGIMIKSKAIKEGSVCGIPDFIGQTYNHDGQTMSPGGPGKLINVLKCNKCGFSVSI